MTKSRGVLSPRTTWSKDQDAELVRRYPDEKAADIAKDFSLSLHIVYARAKKLGLEKSAAFNANPAMSGRTDGARGQSGRFRKGQKVWNKGIRFTAGGRSAETRFKPGSLPFNHMPVGSERLSNDGYLQRKMTETGYPPRDWVAVHILTWIEHNGPVPEGHAVVFKDGNRKNGVIENLECISRADLMKRNTRHNLPKELNEIIQLRAVLSRQINKRSKA